ncbi:VOC family protein [Ancylobacter pratisalsi]|uniref:VOC family protein n=1 Tax=Ancylobacter pratisalsi TaxID=1745854 RepID=A0A6P1YP58_9HYPH|nr:VOC family protein [Ancylobacter pratisalsi]QIB34872.1 VOC family protein [Ancylobacter pratisalsi]
MTPVRPMIEHMSIGVSDFARSLAFYDAVLASLGFVRVMCFAEPEGESACWGPEGELPSPEGTPGAAPFWIQHRSAAVIPPPGFHLCFMAPDRAAVRAFHAAGVVSGGRDEGAPGLRPHYGEGYYAAFLFDPDGWKIEAVTYTAA